MNYGEIVCEDALRVLSSLREKCADIVFLDPPFNLGKRYGKNGSHHDKRKESEYIQYMETVIRQGARVLKDGGALYLYHIPKWAIRLSPFLEECLQFRHWIAISILVIRIGEIPAIGSLTTKAPRGRRGPSTPYGVLQGRFVFGSSVTCHKHALHILHMSKRSATDGLSPFQSVDLVAS
ncbi:MAG: hypothetical protein CME04_16380 [Gemmatimonadaceae bacterium]|jgi:hypothetical protein|nr:hypothetical protein [Gemmatimonadaceae bacterium]|tara:strand:+ start:88 stop:624 length:537 start_codon:yes stop_codon:yes gene_type:complete